MPRLTKSLCAMAAASLALTGCGRSDGPLAVAFIDSEQQVFAGGLRLSYGGQIVRAATGAGLVTLNAQGEVVPSLADRWIVADDGRSYIFRLRDGDWPGGADLTGESARDSLRGVLRELRGTSLGLDLAAVSEVRAMAGRVVEIRLTQPMPDFLRLLAQPELTLSHRGFPSGPMLLERSDGEEGTGDAVLSFRPPEARGLPADEHWQARVRPIAVSALDPEAALAAFENAEVDVVLGGRLGVWPLADPGPLSRGTRRIDPAIGLFGLLVRREDGFLSRTENREALAMAIDRPALLSPFNIGGWLPTTRIVPGPLAGEGVTERWEGIEIGRLRGEARRRVQTWSAGAGEGPVVTVGLSDQPGNAALFNELARQWAEIGVTLRRAGEGQEPDLVLIDSVARYAASLWFLNQFNCTLRRGMCSAEADAEVRLALEAPDLQARADSLARAEAMLTAANIYIPLAMPLRWSLVRGNVEGYFANQWAWHPLPDMAIISR